MEFEHDATEHRWVGLIDGQVVTALDYADDGRVVSMTRTFTNPPFRGRGLAAQVVERAVDAAAEQGRRVRPMCWYVAAWFEQHPERADLLA